MRPINKTLYADVTRSLARCYKAQEDLRRLEALNPGVYEARLNSEITRSQRLEKQAGELYETWLADVFLWRSVGDFWTYEETGEPRVPGWREYGR
jgi:hypothetical protein